MAEAVGWTGVVIAIAAMIRGEFAAYTARQLAKEKAEADRQAARDKMEFDLKTRELELKHEANEEKIGELVAEIDECKRDRQQLWEKLNRSAADREQLWDKLAAIERTKKDRTDERPAVRTDPD